MTIPKDVKNALTKVIRVFQENPNKLTSTPSEYSGKLDNRAYTVQNLETLSLNHFFDDNYNFCGITHLEGCTIRHYFSNETNLYQLVMDLRKEFSDFFKYPEAEDYLEYARERTE